MQSGWTTVVQHPTKWKMCQRSVFMETRDDSLLRTIKIAVRAAFDPSASCNSCEATNPFSRPWSLSSSRTSISSSSSSRCSVSVRMKPLRLTLHSGRVHKILVLEGCTALELHPSELGRRLVVAHKEANDERELWRVVESLVVPPELQVEGTI